MNWVQAPTKPDLLQHKRYDDMSTTLSYSSPDKLNVCLDALEQGWYTVSEWWPSDHAGMAELVDALDLKSRDHNDRGGSSPPLRTTNQ